MKYNNYSTESLQDIIENIGKIQKIIDKRKKTAIQLNIGDVYLSKKDKEISLYKVTRKLNSNQIYSKELFINPDHVDIYNDEYICDIAYLSTLIKVENIELFDTVWKMVEDFNKENKQRNLNLYNQINTMFNENKK